jgi:hypothetical protein
VLVGVCAAPAFAQNPVPDTTYGPGGSKRTSTETLKDGTTVETIEIRDKDNTLREKITTSVDPNREEVVEHDWYEADGQKSKQTLTKKNAAGRQYYSREDDFVNGVLDSGAIYEEENGRPVHKRFNKKTQQYEPVDPPNAPFDLFKIPGFEEHLNITSAFYAGAVFVWEDSSPRFWTSGVNVSYTHKLTSTWGFAADLQWTAGEQNGVDYTKVLGFVGVALCQHTGRRLYFAPRLLGGVSHVTQGETAFALAAGVDIGRRVSERLDLIGRVEYIPTFADSGIQHNVRVGGGIKVRF